MRRLALSARIGRRARPRSACAESSASCARCGEVSRCGRLWTLKAGVTSRLRISISRERTAETHSRTPGAGKCLSPNRWRHVYTHTHTRALNLDYTDWSNASSLQQLYRIEDWIECVMHRMRVMRAWLDTSLWHHVSCGNICVHMIVWVDDDDDEAAAWSICCRLCVCASSDVRHYLHRSVMISATSVHALHDDVIAGLGQTSQIFTFNTMLHFQFCG